MNEEEKMKRLKRMMGLNIDDNQYDQKLKDALEESEFAALHIAVRIFKQSIGMWNVE